METKKNPKIQTGGPSGQGQGQGQEQEQEIKFNNAYSLLFTRLNERNILWCSWKSNEHLIEGMDGRTDIDLLFHEHDRQAVTDIMHDCGFILFQAPSFRSYPGVVDALSVDPHSGRILHAHSHFLLTIGEKNLKSLILPWGDEILKARVPSEISSQVFTSSQSLETVLLLLRESLKIKWRSKLRQKSQEPWGGQGFKAELNWLKKRVRSEDVAQCAKDLLNEDIAHLIREAITQGVTFSRLSRLQSLIKRHADTAGWRRMSAGLVLYKIWLNQALYLITRLADKARIEQHMVIRRRILPDHGLVVAFLGPDGAGKSTVTKKITSQWKDKIDITRIYFGTGDGPQPFLHWLWKTILSGGLKFKYRLNKERNKAKERKGQDAQKAYRLNPGPSLTTIIYAVTGALAKKKKMRRISRLRKRGFIVICDRWPQNQVSGINDGPFLSPFRHHANFLYRVLAGWEERQFNKICSVQRPDIVIRLLPSLDVAINRKKENREVADLIHRKIEQLNRIRFTDDIEEHSINADHPLDDVLMRVRKIIWTNLQKRPAYKPRLYECLGLPGAGKTTVCKTILKGGDMRSVHDVFSPSEPLGKIDKAILTIRSLIFDPVLYLLIIKIIFDHRLWLHKESLSCLFRMPVQKLRLKKAVQTKLHLIEQLLLQNLWSAFVSAEVYAVRPDSLAPFIARLYHDMDASILYFEADCNEAARRVSQRQGGTSRFESLSQEEISKRLGSGSALMRDIVKSASYAGLQINRVDASFPVDTVEKQVSHVVCPFIHP